jgi:TatD DNase family protein
LRTRKGGLLPADMPRDVLLPQTDGPFGQVDGNLLLAWESSLAVDILSKLWGNPVAQVEERMKSKLRRLAI